MPILNDRIVDQIDELLPEYINEEGQGLKKFLTAYFDFLEKGILIHKEGTDLDTIGLEDGEGSLLQQDATFSPSPKEFSKFLYEKNLITEQTQTGSWQIGEYVVGSTSGATARIDVIGNTSNKLYIEVFTEAQFLPDETIVGQNSGYTAKVDSFEGGALFAANNLLDYADVDKTTGDFLEYFRRDFMPTIDTSILADKRLLAKHINNVYLAKGSIASYDFLFRILYSEDIEITYPRDNMIAPSQSRWTEPKIINLHSEKNLLEYAKGKIVKRNNEQTVVTEIQADTIVRITSGEGNNVYQVTIMEPYVGSLNIGDSIELQSREDSLKFHLATVRGIVSDIDVTDSNVMFRLESGTGTGFFSAESDDTEAFQLEDEGTGSLLLLESGTQSDNSANEVHGKTPILVRETVNTPQTEAVIGGAMKGEESSRGSLYTPSDQVQVNLPQSELGIGQVAKTMVGEVEDGKVEKVIVDPSQRGSGYSDGDLIVFDNRGSGGTLAQGVITSTSGDILLESGTTFGSLEFVATSGQTTFSGNDRYGNPLVYDPEKIMVRVKRANVNQTIASQGGAISFTNFEEVKGSANIGLNGTSIVFVGTYANSSHANYVGQAGTIIEVFAQPEETTLILEDGLQSTGENKLLFDQSGANPTGAIERVRMTSSGVGFTSLPEAYPGGEVFYSEDLDYVSSTTKPNFQIGETVTSGSTTGIVVDHDKKIKKLVIGKLPTTSDTTTFSVGDTITGQISSTTCTVVQNSFTTGTGAKLLPYGDSIGTIGKLRVIQQGNHFDKSSGIPDYRNHFIYGRASATPVVDTTVTGDFSNATGTIKSINSSKQIISIDLTSGMFKKNETVTASDGKTFQILEGNPATAAAKNDFLTKLDGNYASDVGFPSVTGQRIQDSKFYQSHSYVIKVGRTINDYRSVVKQLLNPAGTIFFGEVAITNVVDGSAETYRSGAKDEGFDGDRITRSFIPTLYIGSKIDPAKVVLEDGTTAAGDDEVFYANEENLIYEDDSGVVVTERFLADDRLKLTLSTGSMSPSGARDFTIGETVSQNLFKTASGDIGTITGRVVDRERDPSSGNLVADPSYIFVDHIQPDHVAMKRFIVEGNSHADGLFLKTGTEWKTDQSDTDIEFVHGIVGASSGKKAHVTLVENANVLTDQGSGQAFIIGQDITESDVGLYDRIIRANVQPHGHAVVKELEILPHYAHHRIYYNTLNNALSIGQTIKNNGVLGRVMEHDTVNKFIIVWSGSDSFGANLGSFSTGAVTNEAGSTTHFTATVVEKHHVHERIVDFSVGNNSPVSVPNKPSTSVDPNTFSHLTSEFYNGETRQHRKNITILQTFASSQPASTRNTSWHNTGKIDTSSNAKETGPFLNADTIEVVNQHGLRGSANTTTIATVGGLDWGETLQSAESGSIINNIPTGRRLDEFVSDAKRINSVANVDEEFIITEDGSYLIEEIDQGFLMREPEPEDYNTIMVGTHQYFGNNWTVDPTEELTLEDGGRLTLEDATDIEEHERFVTERSFNLGSYFTKTEDQDTMVYEDGTRIIQENAISFGEPVERIGPTLGDLARIGFSQTLKFEERITQEDGDNILMESEAGRLLVEAPYEGVKISDISTLYPNRSISDLQEHGGRSMILNYPSSVQSGV